MRELGFFLIMLGCGLSYNAESAPMTCNEYIMEAIEYEGWQQEGIPELWTYQSVRSSPVRYHELMEDAIELAYKGEMVTGKFAKMEEEAKTHRAARERCKELGLK